MEKRNKRTYYISEKELKEKLGIEGKIDNVYFNNFKNIISITVEL